MQIIYRRKIAQDSQSIQNRVETAEREHAQIMKRKQCVCVFPSRNDIDLSIKRSTQHACKLSRNNKTNRVDNPIEIVFSRS